MTDSQVLRQQNRQRRGMSFELDETSVENAQMISGLRAKLEELHTYGQEVHIKCNEMDQSIKDKEKKVAELDSELSELLKLESILGYSYLKDQAKMSTTLIKEFETVKNQNRGLSKQVQNLEFDQQAKQNLIASLQKEVVMLVFLNGRLSQQLAEVDPESTPSRYSVEFFKKNKKLKGHDLEMYNHVKDQQSIRIEQQNEINLLRAEIEGSRKEAEQLRRQNDAKMKELAEAKAEIDKLKKARTETTNQPVSSVQTAKLSPFEELNQEESPHEMREKHEAKVERESLLAECTTLRAQIKELVVMNDNLNLTTFDLQIERDSLKQSLLKLQKEEQSILELHRQVVQEKTALEVQLARVGVEKQALETELNIRSDEQSLFNRSIAYFQGSLKELKDCLGASKLHEEKRSTTEHELLASLEKWTEHQSTLLTQLSQERRKTAECEGISVQKEFEAKVQFEKNQLLQFKVEALSAYSATLEQKARNLETSLSEFLARIKVLEAERESMETNAALEAVQTFLETKKAELEATSQRLDSVFEDNEKVRQAETKAVSELALTTQETIHELEAKFGAAKAMLEARVIEVQEQARQSLEHIKIQGQASLQSRADEIALLKQKLDRAELEGNSEIKKDLEALLSANDSLQKELTILETRLALEVVNSSAIQEMEKIEQSLLSAKHAQG